MELLGTEEAEAELGESILFERKFLECYLMFEIFLNLSSEWVYVELELVGDGY